MRDRGLRVGQLHADCLIDLHSSPLGHRDIVLLSNRANDNTAAKTGLRVRTIESEAAEATAAPCRRTAWSG